MMDFLALRVLLACTLVFWSPGWCCCALGGSACGKAAVTAASAHDDVAGPAAAVPDTCCTTTPVSHQMRSRPQPAGACCGTEPGGGSDGPSSPARTCMCGQHTPEAQVTRSMVLPGLENAGVAVLQALMALPAIDDRIVAERLTCAASAGVACMAPVRAQTLLAQHCLLTT